MKYPLSKDSRGTAILPRLVEKESRETVQRTAGGARLRNCACAGLTGKSSERLSQGGIVLRFNQRFHLQAAQGVRVCLPRLDGETGVRKSQVAPRGKGFEIQLDLSMTV